MARHHVEGLSLVLIYLEFLRLNDGYVIVWTHAHGWCAGQAVTA